MFPTRNLWIALMALAMVPAAASHAGPIAAGTDLLPSVAVQTVDLFAGSPFNPGPGMLTVQLTATGSFIMVRAEEANDAIAFTIPTASFLGTLPSPLPGLSFDLLAGTPDLGQTTGQITDVVQNQNDPGFASGAPSSFVSGDFTTSTYFKLVLGNGATIYTDPNDAAVFTATLTGLPAPAGTVFSGSDRVNLYLQTGPGFDPSRDPIIGQSYDRTVTVASVPEPSSIVLSLLGSIGMMAILRYRRTRSGIPDGR
jgi:hypothetical protein